ncbi:MAG: Acetylglutamate kinase [Alphaproteobacteria bacterium MarineAlpha5_Bin5]|nr:MAG: Acetylglutamate kinase [Alphaproteobacteria bacterium MarineAlpha5_Bin5]PPR52663.1 MAG: Acetylglutamate kinase [Alphaproteobacteria bacterium MarineAlpha5_Bin4]|tara:strand:+ start:9550 stop:10461 length:912 start_codon:yes stop_codon:yes gene_type:complete
MKFDFLSESDQAYFIHKASTLVEALPYIRQHSGDIVVIKYGGHAMGNPKLSKSFSKDIGLIKEVGIHPIIVHGGGPQIGERLKLKNIKSRFVDGLRVTDKDTVKIVEEVLAKDINKEIVDSINSSGGKAISLAGNRDNLINAKKLNVQIKDSDSNIEKIVDIGFVGQPTNVKNDLIMNHINKGEIPVIAPLGIDAQNNSYNINADTVAGFIAGTIKASKLLLLTDVAGILDENDKLISSLSLNDAKKIVKQDFVLGGMKPKILTCIDSMKKGVKKSTILDGRIPHALILELFTEHGIGTQIFS